MDEKVKVLFVDDTKYLGPRYIYAFDGSDIQPFFASDVENMTKIMRKEQPDIIVLDYLFRNCSYNGYDLAKIIKQYNENINVIIISGSINETLIEQFSEIGITEFISKPFSNYDLFKIIRKLTWFKDEKDKDLHNFIFMPEDRRNIILVVENNDMMIRFYKTLFDDKYDIIDAKNVRDTIYAYSKSKNIKLVILDYNLGEENFDKILDFVKTNFEESKKLIVTGYHDIDYLKEIYKNDVDDIIPKPIGFSFKHKVIEMIGDSGLENKLFY